MVFQITFDDNNDLTSAFTDSLRNIFVIFYMDREMNKKINEKLASTSTSIETSKKDKGKKLVKRKNKLYATILFMLF